MIAEAVNDRACLDAATAAVAALVDSKDSRITSIAEQHKTTAALAAAPKWGPRWGPTPKRRRPVDDALANRP